MRHQHNRQPRKHGGEVGDCVGSRGSVADNVSLNDHDREGLALFADNRALDTPAVAAARDTLGGTDPGYVAQQITRMEASVASDPALAVGTAKELVETCCKTILNARGIAFSRSADLPELVKMTIKELALAPNDIPDSAKAAETVKRLLNNLATITQGVAELRNQYGTGHGKAAGSKGLGPRHAKLAVGAASTLAVFLAETHNEKPRQ